MQYEHDPPVHFASNEEEPDLQWELSHARLSAFLDALAYAHAFAGGAGVWVAARTVDDLEHVRQTLGVSWKTRW